MEAVPYGRVRPPLFASIVTQLDTRHGRALMGANHRGHHPTDDGSGGSRPPSQTPPAGHHRDSSDSTVAGEAISYA